MPDTVAFDVCGTLNPLVISTLRGTNNGATPHARRRTIRLASLRSAPELTK